MEEFEQQKNVILDWMRKIHTLEYAHRYESMRWSKFNLYLGIPALILAVVIGSVSNLPDLEENKIEFVVSTGAILVAILSGLQTFLKPTEVAEKHRATSSTYEKLRHRIEVILKFENSDTDKLREQLNQFRTDWADVDSFNVSDKNFKKGKDRVKSFKKYPEELGFLDTR